MLLGLCKTDKNFILNYKTDYTLIIQSWGLVSSLSKEVCNYKKGNTAIFNIQIYKDDPRKQ